MSVLFFILSLIAMSLTISADQPTTQIKQYPNITIILHNTQDARSNNSTTVTNTQTSKGDSPLLKKILDACPDLKTLPRAARDEINKLSTSSNNFLDTYKWQIIGGTLVTTYISLCYLIISGNSYLGQSELWSSWRQELPLDQLLAIPQEQFAKELLREIHRRYTDSTTITDLVRPLSLFMISLEQEEEYIKWYQSVYSWISYLKLNKIVPFSKQRFGKINERLQRLAYYKNAFLSWAADYQLEQAARCARTILSQDEHDLALAQDLIEEKISFDFNNEKRLFSIK